VEKKKPDMENDMKREGWGWRGWQLRGKGDNLIRSKSTLV
jgi:hypothetical protein